MPAGVLSGTDTQPASSSAGAPVKTPISSGVNAQIGSPLVHRPSEGHVGIEAESAPRLESILRVARGRDHLHRGPARARQDDEAGLGADEPQRVLQAGVADVAASRRQGEGRGNPLEPFRLLRSRCGPLLRQSTLELLERETGLIREPADDGDRRRIGPIDGRLPRNSEHQLRFATDDDR